MASSAGRSVVYGVLIVLECEWFHHVRGVVSIVEGIMGDKRMTQRIECICKGVLYHGEI